jgi:outer membrane protein assembly factor BamE
MRLVVILSIFLLSCSFQNPIDIPTKVYKLDIKQGNEIDSEMLLQLKPGMTKSQVRFVLGTPLIQDSFHNQRWDYLYIMRKNGKLIDKRHVIVNFEKDLLKSITGEVITKNENGEFISNEKYEEPSHSQVVNKDEADESSWLEKLKFWEEKTEDENDTNSLNNKAPKESDKADISNNTDVMKKTDIKESINEAVRADIKNKESEDLLNGDIRDKKSPTKDKEAIINSDTDSEESDYFNLLLEKIGF